MVLKCTYKEQKSFCACFCRDNVRARLNNVDRLTQHCSVKHSYLKYRNALFKTQFHQLTLLLILYSDEEPRTDL